MEIKISELTNDILTNKDFIPEIYNQYKDKEERDLIIKDILKVAKDKRVVKTVKKAIEEAERKVVLSGDVYFNLHINNKDETEVTIENYTIIIKEDKNINCHIRYNAFIGKYEYWFDQKKHKEWDDSNDSELLRYIENTYDIYSPEKYQHAMNGLRYFFSYHPIKDIIEKEKWDGKPRIDNFLHEIMKCNDDDYSREVSRMIFYGGISRIYNPGCKFDYMPIFMGSQGIGKSSIVNWLALRPDFYREVLSIDGKEGIESITGGWICEFSELLAMTRAREIESLKGYVTRQNDSYRPPYARHTLTLPRTCIFVGTTNDFEFLSDKTGNRRYLPIEIKLKRGELYEREAYVKNYILECWREALELLRQDKIYLVIPSKYNSIVEQHQASATDDDPKVGMVADYLDNKKDGDTVCGMEIYINCFNNIQKNYTKQNSREISMIMRMFPEWIRVDKPKSFEKYGRQKYWIKNDK